MMGSTAHPCTAGSQAVLGGGCLWEVPSLSQLLLLGQQLRIPRSTEAGTRPHAGQGSGWSCGPGSEAFPREDRLFRI